METVQVESSRLEFVKKSNQPTNPGQSPTCSILKIVPTKWHHLGYKVKIRWFIYIHIMFANLLRPPRFVCDMMTVWILVVCVCIYVLEWFKINWKVLPRQRKGVTLSRTVQVMLLQLIELFGFNVFFGWQFAGQYIYHGLLLFFSVFVCW